MVSWGYGCAAEDALGIYSEVSHFTDWLYEQMPDLNTCPPLKSSTGPTPSGNSTQEGKTENFAMLKSIGNTLNFSVAFPIKIPRQGFALEN